MRTLTTEFKDAIEFGPIHPALLVYLDFNNDPLRAWSGFGTLSHGGFSWLGLGEVADVSSLSESADIRTTEVQMRLNRVPNSSLADLTGTEWKGRAAEVDLALFAEDGQTLISAERLFTGTMDVLNVSVGPGNSTIEVTLVNELVRLRGSYGYRYTAEDHKLLHPSDTALRFSAIIQNKQLNLGA